MKSALSKNLILVIDRDGLVGEPLSIKLSKEFLVVLVSRRSLDLDVKNQSIVHAPFLKKFPIIPDSKYSHIFFIDEEAQDLEFLPKIIEKVKKNNSEFIFIQKLSEEKKYAISRVLREYPMVKPVLLGDVFSNELVLRKEKSPSTINEFIYQAQRFGRIKILGEGLRQTYPVFLDDAIDCLANLVSGVRGSCSLFYIFPKHPPSELSLAHMIQKANPEIAIDFIRSDLKSRNISYPVNGKNLLGDKYSLTKRIRGVDIKKKVKERDRDVDNKAKGIKNFLFFTAWTLMFSLLFPFIFTMFFSLLGLNILDYAKKEIDNGNLAIAKNSSHLSQVFFYLGKQTGSIFFLQAKIVGQEKRLQRLLEDIALGSDMSEGLAQALDFGVYFSDILNGKSKNPTEDFAKGRNAFKRFVVVLNKLRAEEKIPLSISQNLESVNPLIRLLSSTLEIMPSILGMEREKAYLVLFQDNMELRPGGGLIDLYGILKLNKGKIMQFTLNDISDADKQLKGHVEPPFGLRRYLPSRHWYMRDSNFDVDFIKSALSAANFLFAETGQKVDGVVGIDSSLRAKLAGAKPPSLVLAQTISDALLRKHLLLTFNESQNIFTVNGWSSSLWDGREDNKENVNDFIGVSETNLGLNKANYFIRRQISQKVTLQDNGNISEELTINYKNESKNGSGGDYKNYLRIILPENTKLSEISINDKSQNIIGAITDPIIYEAKNFQAPQGLEVEKTIEDGKSIFGFLVKIPAGEIAKVKLNYALPGSISGLNTFFYNLRLFKQPGTDSIPYSFSLAYPGSFNVVKSSAGIIEGEERVSFSEKVVRDKDLVINFTKK